MRLFFLFFCILLSIPAFAFAVDKKWEDLEKEISKKFPVSHISTEALASILTKDELAKHYILIDTRPLEEYQTSHLRDAIRVDPDLKVEQFIEKFGEKIKNKHCVFYCSVGYRSAAFISRVSQAAQESGALTCANLRGGLFRWYNEKRPVYQGEKETDEIHPYDSYWGQFVIPRAPSTAPEE